MSLNIDINNLFLNLKNQIIDATSTSSINHLNHFG